MLLFAVWAALARSIDFIWSTNTVRGVLATKEYNNRMDVFFRFLERRRCPLFMCHKIVTEFAIKSVTVHLKSLYCFLALGLDRGQDFF